MTAEWRLDKIYQAVNGGEIPGDCFTIVEEMVNGLEIGVPLADSIEILERLFTSTNLEGDREVLLEQMDNASIWVRKYHRSLDLELDPNLGGQ